MQPLPRILRRSFLLILFLSVGQMCRAQTPTAGDCLGAFTVCALNYNQALSFTGEGNYNNEINATTSCLSSGERNNSWYIITVQTPGTFGFNITPNCDAADYDWALYNLTNSNCSDIAIDASLEVACNFSGQTFPTAVTGMNNGPNAQDAATINVTTGQVYALNINNFTGENQCGYILDLSISTAGIIDQSAPTLNAITSTMGCGSTSITFTYSEFVKCSTVLQNEFLLVGPDNDTIPVIGLSSIACVNGGSYDREFTVILSEAILIGGVYEFVGFGNVEDLCGNFISDPQTIFFNINTIEINATLVTPVDCRVNNGSASATLTALGVAPYTFAWQPSNQGIFATPLTTHTATSLPYGMQYITVTDNTGCVARDSVFVSDVNNFQVTVTTDPDTCSLGWGGAQVTVSGGQPYETIPAGGIRWKEFDYFWNTPYSPNDTDFVDNLLTGTYEMTVIDSFGCIASVTFFIPDDRLGLIPDFIYSPDDNPITGIFPTVTFINQSQGDAATLWDFGTGEVSYESDPDYVFTGSGTWDVKLIISNSQGCRDSITRQVTIDFLHTFFAPNAFSPNDDYINDSFNVVTSGIFDSTYFMVIFDRWGSEVFTTADKRLAWDGKDDSGKKCQSGLYIYRLSYIDQSGKKHVEHGKIVLLG